MQTYVLSLVNQPEGVFSLVDSDTGFGGQIAVFDQNSNDGKSLNNEISDHK